jgi:hypothetical protein
MWIPVLARLVTFVAAMFVTTSGSASANVLVWNDSRQTTLAPKRDRGGAGVEHRMVTFDVDAVVRDLGARLHPNAEFLEAILTGKRPQRVASDA